MSARVHAEFGFTPSEQQRNIPNGMQAPSLHRPDIYCHVHRRQPNVYRTWLWLISVHIPCYWNM